MAALTKARLIELDQKFNEKRDGKKVTVQFNPDTLKVTFANQVVEPKGGDQSSGTKSKQFVGAGTTKLTLTLWFDVTAMTQDAVDDVRRLTSEVIYFMDAQPTAKDSEQYIPPALRFSWGSFLFDGVVEGIEESLEFFSPDGKPLRASVNLTLSQKKILVSKFTDDGSVQTKGNKPLSPAKSGDSIQSLAGDKGKNGGWQGIAAANGIEDPLRLKPGQLIDLNASAAVGGGFGVSAGASIGAAASVTVPQLTLPSVSTRFGVN
jgi:hypothetical protein